jgi:3-deoxy-manno-octulosonate cytidylyltransferase (CMP-KDO synthetase)
MNIIGVIPARYGSTRFEGKPLAKIGNKTMIEWTYIHSKQSQLLSEVYVATDDERIFNVVKNFGGKVLLTKKEHSTGTDRIIEAIHSIPDVDIIVNIQGDEPGIEKELIDGVIDVKLKNRNFEMSTAAIILPKEDWSDPNKVKVIFDKKGRAIYFSRSLIPSNFKVEKLVYKHIGIYCYEKKFLLEYNSLPESNLEISESLEQLRAIENGYSIGVYISNTQSLAVDTQEDLLLVIEDFKKKELI